MQRLILATNNENKLIEMRRMLYPSIPNLQSVSTFSLTVPEETGLTYEDNAKIKADHCFSVSGEPSLADDSGIEIVGMYGGPGVESARLAPTQEERIAEILQGLGSDSPANLRKAKQRCVLCFKYDSNDIVYFEGVLNYSTQRVLHKLIQ